MDTKRVRAAFTRPSFFILPLIFLTLSGTLPAWAATSQDEPSVLSVQVSRSQIREYPSALAPILATLSYGEQVRIFGTPSDGWAQVYLPGSTRLGYMYLSALTQVRLDASELKPVAQGFSGGEIALAGKGFSESAEETYRRNSQVDYAPVDAMEDFEYGQETLEKFLEAVSP